MWRVLIFFANFCVNNRQKKRKQNQDVFIFFKAQVDSMQWTHMFPNFVETECFKDTNEEHTSQVRLRLILGADDELETRKS